MGWVCGWVRSVVIFQKEQATWLVKLFYHKHFKQRRVDICISRSFISTVELLAMTTTEETKEEQKGGTNNVDDGLVR